jgi:alpha-N-acetylglucosaminidase
MVPSRLFLAALRLLPLLLAVTSAAAPGGAPGRARHHAHQLEAGGGEPFLRSAAESTPAMQVRAVQAMAGRLLGAQHAAGFAFEIRAGGVADAGRTSFELAPPATAGGVALIRGSTGVELAAGLGHYLRHVANVSFSWPGTGGTSFGGEGVELPPLTAGAPEARRFVRAAKWLNTWNVCTFSYSFVWWSFERWQAEIDLMALFGVNLPLAYVGQEAVVRALYRKPPYRLT